MSICANCGQENPEGFRFCGACGAPLEAEAPAPQEERKIVTAVFTDIVGSTARAEQLDPEDVRAMLAPYYARLRRELESHGGTVEKFIGDAVVALFGAPVAHEDDPERAVRAALAIRDAVADLNASDDWLDLHIRTAVHTGEALVVLGASAIAGEGMAAGDVMNTAARLQSGAPIDGVVVGEATYAATQHAIEYRDAEPVQAKGKSEPIPIWEVVGVKADPGRRPISRAPLVGRGAELERLHEAWDRVVGESEPGVATVLGPPGIGKSRLLIEFAEHVKPAAAVHWGRCLSYGEGITYWPVTEIVKSAVGILHDDDERMISAKLGDFLQSLPTSDRDELRTMAAALANLVGARTTPEGTYITAEITQAELHWGIRRVIELVAAEQPLVLVFEDLHWAEPTLLDLLRNIAENARRAPVLLLASARPELADERPAILAENGNRRVVELDALGADASRALLGELLGRDAAANEALEGLLRNAGGNPLFLEETVRMLADAGTDLASEDLPGGIEALGVPSTLQALIGSRLDQLPPPEKRVAQSAAVVGTVFWPGALAAINGMNGDLPARLEALERRDFVRANEGSTVAGEREYAFKHILIRDVAYGQVPKGRRTELHVRFADWVSALPGAADEFVEIVAYHLEQASRLAREVARSPIPPPILPAAEALARAAEKAERREGIREADRFYARGLELVGDEHVEKATELRLGRARMQVALGELSRAHEELLDVAEQGSALGRLDLRCSALIALGNIAGKQGRADEARRRLVEAEAIAVEIGDRRLEVQAVFGLAAERAWFGEDALAAIEDVRRGVRIAEQIDDRALRTEGHLRLGFLFFNIGDLGQCEEELERCLSLAREVGSHRDEARATFLLGLVKYYRGELDVAERLNLQTRDWLERTCEAYFQTQNLSRALALYALARGDPALAEERLKEALKLALEAGGWVVAEIYRYLTEALVEQGRRNEAETLAEFAGQGISGEDQYEYASALLAQGIAEENAETARASFTKGLELLDELHMPVELGEGRLAYARALRRLDDVAGAREQLERARETFARLGASGLLTRLEGELEAVAGGAGVAAGPADSD